VSDQKIEGFYQLQPEVVLDVTEDCGFAVTGEFTQLNSYENRVFDIKLENGESVIAKFYRPGRWDQETILEEHAFLQELKEEGIYAVAPLSYQGSTLASLAQMWVAFFPKIRARMPQELLPQDLKQMGRMLARVHNVGAQKDFQYRPILDSSYYGGWQTLDDLQSWIAPEVRHRYNQAAEIIISAMEEQIDVREYIRIHGDCHRGNILMNGQEYFLVDFDDVCMGPVVQDVWMLLSADQNAPEEFNNEIGYFLEGYEELRVFPDHQWNWVSILRGIRIIGYAGWIARRWSDPSFPKIFPEFNTYRYWAEETEALIRIARLII
jgi:Ser/Thr protein kinase RdoA (MazF antagonist)